MGPLTILVSMLIAAPEIASVAPSPLPRLATAEISGTGFVSGITSVSVGEVSQQVLFAESGRVRFLVSSETPLGTQNLRVVVAGASGGETSATVEVVAAMPKMTDVTPETLVLGRLGTVVGTDLDGVSAVTIDGIPCELTEQTGYVLVFIVPFDSAILGNATLVLESPSGNVTRNVTVSAPPPVIDALVPNPLRAAGLLTIRGQILPLPVEASLGALTLPIVSVSNGEVVVFVPPDTEAGAHQVVVKVGAQSSVPAGPLNVLEADEDAPRIDAVFPTKVARGGELVVVGDGLDGIDEASAGLTVISCERQLCRLGTGSREAGPRFGAAVSGPSGAAIFELEIADEEPTVPELERAEPAPAFRGERLTIRGSHLESVRSVVLGGIAQSVAFVDADRVEIDVDLRTSLGAERLVLIGNTASAPLTVTVLDAWPEEGPEVAEPGPDTVEVAEPTVEADTAVVERVESETVENPEEGGCASGGTDGFGLVVCALAGLLRGRTLRR
jgi:hypothetical protein